MIALETAPDVLTVREMAELLRVSTDTIYNLHRGKAETGFPSFQLMHRIVCSKAALVEYMHRSSAPVKARPRR